MDAGNGRDDVGQDERADRDERDGERGDGWFGYDVQCGGESFPERAADDDAERHAEDHADADGDAGLPGNRRGELSAREAERLEQCELRSPLRLDSG